MHPGFAIVFDNIDGKRECWHMPKDNQNFDFYWVNHKIIMNKYTYYKNNRSLFTQRILKTKRGYM